MATVVTVHGTFAHSTGEPSQAADAQRAPDLQWWQGGSTFEQDMRELLDAVPGMGSGKLDITRYEWSGANSEMARREAGKGLFKVLKKLDDQGEPYCVVGHSHGGSVIGWALMEAAARKEPLNGLKRWITVGTPFVGMRRERLLFTRLKLIPKTIFVASFTLLIMFLVYAVSQALGQRALFGGTFPGVLAVTAAMMSLPAIGSYALLKYWDRLSLFHYRRSVIERAKDSFAKRWLSLTHTDDEAVQGLAFLPGAKLDFIDKTFAVSAISLLSVVAVPLLYFALLAWPSGMVALGGWLKTHVYEAHSDPATEAAVRASRDQFRAARKTAGDANRQVVFSQYRESRRSLEKQYPKWTEAEQSVRFKQRFFEEGGKPCPNSELCGGGRSLAINSGLLLNIVTDQLSSAIGGEGVANWGSGAALRLLIPVILVPLISGLLALVFMWLIGLIARLISSQASDMLNKITNDEVKRAAFGNDTQGEIAIGAVDRPAWIDRSMPRLPTALGELVTNYSNSAANNSIAKFRQVIGQLASTEPKHTADTAITTYFTWKELIHASYFDVPEFRTLIANEIARQDGFQPSRRLQQSPALGLTSQWLAEIDGGERRA
ncbi:MAG: hypothetical protein JSS20_15260, partial [Proteobacteria bacterium]|nr:hypothetical protein [Pseudomonadota bacterium]